MSKEKVLATLKSNGEPMKAGEIAEVSGVDKKEVDKALKTLMAEDFVQSPKRCFYEAK
ncbi:MAG: helix-turn-helix domain-containing protein [bacterium]